MHLGLEAPNNIDRKRMRRQEIQSLFHFYSLQRLCDLQVLQIVQIVWPAHVQSLFSKPCTLPVSLSAGEGVISGVEPLEMCRSLTRGGGKSCKFATGQSRDRGNIESPNILWHRLCHSVQGRGSSAGSGHWSLRRCAADLWQEEEEEGKSLTELARAKLSHPIYCGILTYSSMSTSFCETSGWIKFIFEKYLEAISSDARMT